MGPTPITAPYRLRMLYTVDSFQHSQGNLCDVVASADPSGWDLVNDRGGSNIGLQDAVDEFFTRIAPFYDDAWAAFDGWVLESWVDPQYFYLDSGIVSISPSGSGAMEIANGLTISGKSTDQKNQPFMIYEGMFGSATKVNAAGALGSNARSLMNYVFNADVTAAPEAAWFWRVSRGNFPSKRWLAWITDTSETLRQARRIK